MTQSVAGTQSETLPDGTVHVTTSYSDGSRSEAWTHPAGSPAANLQSLQQKAQSALTTNATFQAITSPTNAQTLAQLQALTKQCNGIIRLLLSQLDTTSGT